MVLLAVLLGLALIGIVSNAVFVVGQCRALRKRGCAATVEQQAFIFLALIPGLGWNFFDRLEKGNVSEGDSHAEI